MEVADGIATVDLSAEFAGDGDADADLQAAVLAQVVFTLTRFEEIDGVRFLVDGVPSANLSAAVASDPATRADFADLLPAGHDREPHLLGQQRRQPPAWSPGPPTCSKPR